MGHGGPAFALSAAALVVRARRRLGDRDRVGTGEGIFEPKLQRIVELLFVARVLLTAALAVRLVLEIIIVGQAGSMPGAVDLRLLSMSRAEIGR